MEVSFQRTKREDFYTHYVKGVLAYVVISRSFEDFPHEKEVSPRISLIRIWNYFLISIIHRKLLFRMHLKEMLFLKLPFLGSTSLQIRKKLQKLFNNKLTSCKSKIVLRNPLESKAFSPSRIRYLGCYFQDLFTSISVVAEMLPIMVRPNAIFNSEFVNI